MPLTCRNIEGNAFLTRSQINCLIYHATKVVIIDFTEMSSKTYYGF